jgi:integrase
MGRLYRRRKSKMFWIDFLSPNSERIRESAKTQDRKLAEQFLIRRKKEVYEFQRLGLKRDSDRLFRDFSKEFLERYSEPNKKSWRSSDAVSIKHLNEFFGAIELSKLTQEMIESYIAYRRRQKIQDRGCFPAPASINRELSCLRTLLTKAVEWGKLKANPCAKVRKLKENNQRARFLTKPEIERLLSVCQGKLRLAISILINTGMRKGELLGLKWVDLDFDRSLITLLNTKNGKPRHIPMNDVVKQAFLQIRLKKGISSLVFPGSKGKMWDFRTSFEIARKKAGLSDVRLHDLRHTFASHLCMSGADLMTVKELLGHSTLVMTQRYSHLTDRHKAQAVQKLNIVNWAQIEAHPEDGDESTQFEKIVSALK